MDTVAQPTAGTLAQRLRLRIYEHFVEHARPPLVEELMSEFDLSRSETVAVLDELVERRDVALVRGTARILMAFPFSAVATPFVARAGGQSYYANCSWDSIAFHEMLGEAVDIDAFCHHCAAPIRIEMRDGRAATVQPTTTIVHLSLRPAVWWEDIISSCSNKMVYFCSTAHRDASGVETATDKSASLTPDEVHALGRPLYRERLMIGYERPGAAALTEHFGALGLTGPFWSF